MHPLDPALQEELTNSFRSHANYIDAFATLCRSPYHSNASPFGPDLANDLTPLASAIAAAPSIGSGAGPSIDTAQVQRSLANAWGTELILGFGGTLGLEDELTRFMNNWAVVQAYYVTYHAAQALIVSRGGARPQSHSATQNQFSDFWSARTLDLPPWSVSAVSAGFRNTALAAGPIDPSIHVWTACTPTNCWDLACKVLNSTREEARKVRERDARHRKRSAALKAWREEEKERAAKGRGPRSNPPQQLPRLSAAEKQDLDNSLRGFTLMDYLYRLRIKTNYVDADMFVEGPPDTAVSVSVHKNLEAISSSTMLAHEIHVGVLVGKAQMLGWVDQWLGRNARGDLGLARRKELLESSL